jgi:hypothetical protein
MVMANVSAWRFGLPRAHNEFAIASITLGGVAAVAVMVALVSDGMSGWSVSDPSARQMAVELATRFAWLAAPCAMLATILGALGRRFRFAAPRLSRGGMILGMIVLVECCALALGWLEAAGLGR